MVVEATELGFPMESISAPTIVHSSASVGLRQDRDGLTDYSPQYKPWDVHRGQADDVGAIYAKAVEFECLAARMGVCAGLLLFEWVNILETGETRLWLREAHFCRVRYCPVCQWRRSLMWQARFYQALPLIVEQHSKARWLFLTLTVRNCAVDELGTVLTVMNVAWQRLIKRREFAPVLGWVRTTEVTQGADGSAHPHFHVLLMVPPSWFTGRYYVKHARWVELWGECLRVPYAPSVDIRTVRVAVLDTGQTQATATIQALRGAVVETLKYSTKPSDMMADGAWFLELTRQTWKRRFVATGGVLKDVLVIGREADEDLVLTDNTAEGEDDGSRLAFGWKKVSRRYRREPKEDRAARS